MTIPSEKSAIGSRLTTSVLVVGGCGFLGHHIVSQLLAPSTSAVSVLDLHTTHNRLPNATYHDADITSPTAVRSILQKVRPKIIIHTASPPQVAPSGISRTEKKKRNELFYKVNVDGTRNLLEQAAEVGCVKAFVYTSSASVIHDTVSDLINADERWPVLYSPQQREYYSETKAIAESLVLAANRKDGSDMLTVALRPAGIFGDGDRQALPNMLTAYEKGQTKFQLGANENLFDFTYVGNVAYSHILAAVALDRTHELSIKPLDHERVDGEAFFITNGQPVYFWDFPRMVWRHAGDKTEPQQVWKFVGGYVLALASLVEWLFWFARKTPNLTRAKVQYSVMTRYYSIDKARRLLGYVPKWGMEEAVERSVKWFLEEGKGEKKVQ